MTGLSPREALIVRLVGRGWPNRDVGANLPTPEPAQAMQAAIGDLCIRFGLHDHDRAHLVAVVFASDPTLYDCWPFKVALSGDERALLIAGAVNGFSWSALRVNHGWTTKAIRTISSSLSSKLGATGLGSCRRASLVARGFEAGVLTPSEVLRLPRAVRLAA